MSEIPLTFEFVMDETALALKRREDGPAVELSDKTTLLDPAVSTGIK